MKKVFLVLLAISVAISMFSMAGVMAAGGKSGKITIWAWDPNFNIPVMKEAKTRYEKVNPGVQVDIVEMAKADVEMKLNTVLSSGSKEGLPDIVLIEDYNAQKYLQAYPGAFDDLTQKINHKNFATYKNALMTINGKIYGVPFDSGVCAMFYRTDFMSQAGIKTAELNNLTWDQLIEIGKKVKAKTGKYLMGMDYADGGLIRMAMQSAGQWYFDSTGKFNIAKNPALKEAFLLTKKLADAGIVKQTSGWNEGVAAFNKGDVAALVSACWMIGSIKAEKSQSGKWAIATFPRLNLKSSVNYSNLGGSSWYITQGSSNKAVAEGFMKSTFAADKDFYQKILVGQGAVGTYLPSQNGPAYTAPDPFFGGQKIFADFGSWLKKIPAVNYGIYTYEADSAIMATMPDFLAGKITVDAALKKAEDQVKNQIGQ